MKKTLKKIGAGIASVPVIFSSFATKVFAQTSECTDTLPQFICTIKEKFLDDENKYINSRVQLGLTVLFVVVFLVAIVYSALAGIKFITSQGESGKLEESKNAVKAILMGFGAMIIAIIGLFVIVVLLGGETEDINTVINVKVDE